MRRLILTLLFILCCAIWAMAGLLFTRHSDAAPLPTLFVLPSLTPTATWTASPTATDTPTPTITVTPTITPSRIPTRTPTLSTRMLEVSAVMPGVHVPPTATDFPFGTVLLPEPPQPVEPLPDATDQPPPYTGWHSFESDHPVVRYAPVYWEPRLHRDASKGQYHRSENGSVTFAFEGEGMRVRYVAAQNMGRFEIVVDGVSIDTVDAFAEQLSFPGTQVYFVGPGPHTLTLRGAGKNNASEGYVIGLDALQVYRGSENTLIIPPADATATPLIQMAQVELIAAPPTLAPTGSPVPERITASVVIAYDENGNRAVDPAEGVSGISVRAVEVGTNRVIAQTFTDPQGYAEIEVLTASPIRIVVPYFGEVWDATRRGDRSRFTLLLQPGNQPGLIP